DRIPSADAVVERDRAEHTAARHCLGHDLRPFAGLDVVRFQDEALHAVGEKFLRAIDVVDAPGNHVGSDVNLQIVRALEHLPRAIGDLNLTSSRRLGHAAYSALDFRRTCSGARSRLSWTREGKATAEREIAARP